MLFRVISGYSELFRVLVDPEKNSSPIIKIDSCWKRRNPANPRNIMIGDSLLPKVFLVLVLFIVLSDGKAW